MHSTKQNSSTLDYIVLDFDGTVADTNRYWEGAKKRFLRDLGFRPRKVRELSNIFRGRSLKEFIATACDIAGVVDYDLAKLEALIDNNPNYIGKIAEIPGSTEFILRNYNLGLRQIICTNSPIIYVNDYLSAHSIDHCIHRIFSTYNNCLPKPDPEIYHYIKSYIKETRGRRLIPLSQVSALRRL